MVRLKGRRSARVTILALVSVSIGLVLNPATAQVAGDYAPREGCVKLEGPDIGSVTSVPLADGVTVELAPWTPKPGEPEYIGFGWRADGGEAYGRVKDGGPGGGTVYDWGPGASGTFTVVEDASGRMHGISFVEVCGEPEEPETGSITVIKQTSPATDAEFEFMIRDARLHGGATEGLYEIFRLQGMDDPGTGVAENERSYQSVLPGWYEIWEEPPSGDGAGYWPTPSCTGGDYDLLYHRPLDLNIPLGLFVRVDPGGHAVCTFTNVREEPPVATVTIRKITIPADDAEAFRFTSSIPGFAPDLQHGESAWVEVEPGRYSVTEHPAGGWELGSIGCEGDEVGFSHETATVRLDLDAGDDVTCTFTNVREEEQPEYASITVIKETIPATNAGFGFSVDGGLPWTFTLAGTDDPDTTDVENKYSFAVSPGATVAVTEPVGGLPGGYTFDEVACTGGGDEVTVDGSKVEIEVVAGSDYVCTFTNVQRTPPTSPPTPRPTGAIGDFVWLDSDGDGIQDAGELPLEGVTVQLTDASGKNVLASAITDTNGKYLFGSLDRGTYRVRFPVPDVYDERIESFTEYSVGPADKNSDADPDAQGLTVLIHLDQGEVDLTWDAGIVSTGILGIQVEPTTTTTTTTTTTAAVSAGTLPFTGPGFNAGLAGLAAVAIAGLGGLMVGITVKRGRHERA